MNFENNMKAAGICLTSIATASFIVCQSTPAFCLDPSGTAIYTANQRSAIVINLHPGLGTNINFDPANQTVETIFLDNKSFISVSTNGCLGEPGDNKACPPNSAPTLIHLSLIDDIAMPGVTVVNKKARGKSMLSVVVTDLRKQRRTYIFNLTVVDKNSTKPHIASIEFIPPRTLQSTPNVQAVINPRTASNLIATNERNIRYFENGFNLSVWRGDYKFDFPKYGNIKRFLAAVKAGEKFDAVEAYNLSDKFILKLIELGTPPVL